MKTIYIYKNNTPESAETAGKIGDILRNKGCIIQEECTEETQLVISVGGDGTFLQAAKAADFRDVPYLGINTGHLGFFQEFSADQLELAAETCVSGNYELQSYRTIRTLVETDAGIEELTPAINDVLIRQNGSSLIHLRLTIGESHIENFSGDGILIASSAGSTAYNYSLGGSIVDPRLDMLQLTPVAPANNTSYRSFTSSLILPPDEEITIIPDRKKTAMIVADGREYSFDNISKITVTLSKGGVSIVRLPGYDFWGKVKSKFL